MKNDIEKIEKIVDNLGLCGSLGEFVFLELILKTEKYINETKEPDKLRKTIKSMRKNKRLIQKQKIEDQFIDHFAPESSLKIQVHMFRDDTCSHMHGLVSISDEGAAIYYKCSDPIIKTYLAILHELGHIVLHAERVVKNDLLVWDLEEIDSKTEEGHIKEVEASYFAQDALKRIIELYIDMDYDYKHMFPESVNENNIDDYIERILKQMHKKAGCEYDLSLISDT
ncbi:MAG: hypothetical protein FWH14_05905 [Oscillospiraceae bacterium]|nr:hypothetical protein [Oscillospiraceae bacterium]